MFSYVRRGSDKDVGGGAGSRHRCLTLFTAVLRMSEMRFSADADVVEDMMHLP